MAKRRGHTLRGIVDAGARLDRSLLDPLTGVRCAVAVAVALAVAVATGEHAAGSLATAGAWLTTYAFFQPGYRRRVAPLALAGAGITGVTLVAGFVGGWGWLIVVLTGLLGFGAGLLVAVSGNAAMLATLVTIEFLAVSSHPVDGRTALTQAVLIGGGALLATLVLASPWPRARLGPEARALAALYRNLATYAAALPDDRGRLPDPGPLAEVRQALGSAPRNPRRSNGAAVQGLADEAERLRASLGALAGIRHRLAAGPRAAGAGEGEAVAALDAVATATAAVLEQLALGLGQGRPPAPTGKQQQAIRRAETTLRTRALANAGAQTPWAQARAGDLDLVLALHGQLRTADRIADSGLVAPRGGRRRAATLAVSSGRVGLRSQLAVLRANLTLRSPAGRHALRLGVAAAVAAALSRVLPGPHAYWVAGTTLLILKPDFGSTMVRGLARGAGTLTGAVLSLVVVSLLHPNPLALAVLAALTAWAMFTVYRSNYAVYVAAVTSFVVLLGAFGGLPSVAQASSRVLDNAIGIALGLGIFLAWPTWASTQVPTLLGKLLQSQGTFCAAALDLWIDPARAGSRARVDAAASRARLVRTDAEAAVERMAGEPRRKGPLPVAAAAGVIAAVHRMSLAGLVMAGEAGGGERRPLAALRPLRDGLAVATSGLAAALGGEATAPGMPHLRRIHEELARELLAATGEGLPADQRATVIEETDVMVDALDTVGDLVFAPP